ncbi:Uncharacterised protein [Chromobacterium violaceum]|uniref:PRTase-CE domain-containing protein n=1 Tax=Chromobacterium violaceum TaxID=536 RepID=A0A3S4HN89_CHRVL|nr:Uncharacterised protein [Chromobacterium violaceum]
MTKSFLEKGYVSRNKLIYSIENIVRSEKICGRDLSRFWSQVSILNVQQDGNSQVELADLLAFYVKKHTNINLPVNEFEKGILFYIDDFMFTGGRLRSDLSGLNEMLERKKTVIVLYMSVCSSAAWQYNSKWKGQWGNLDIVKAKRVMPALENRLSEKNFSDKFWMHSDSMSSGKLSNYIENFQRFNPSTLRNLHCGTKFFPNAVERFNSEIALCEAGIDIIERHGTVKPSLKPMGYDGYDGFGFGGTMLSYRNCPNNLPLAYWWSLGEWLPLFERKVYER